jgi:hypothetical protein
MAPVALALLVWFLVITLLQRTILFPRRLVRADSDAGEDVPGLERLSIDSPEGQVEGWFLPGDGVSRERPGPLVIFAHGNGELIDDWPAALTPYRRLGASVLLPEFRGYGRSAGSPSQAAIAEDFIRFYDTAVGRSEVDRTRVVFHGRSLGGGAACDLAIRRRPTALILQSTFTSVRTMARRFLVPGFLVRDPFDNAQALRGLAVPTLIFHGRQDKLIPLRQAEELSRTAAGPVTFVALDGDHNAAFVDRAEIWQRIEAFLREARVLR